MTTDPIRDALAELVALENIKRDMARLAAQPDYLDRPEDVAAYDELSRSYSERRPAAWHAARAALSLADGAGSTANTRQPDNVRTGDPYDDPAFEELAREHDVWGRAAGALCAVFWRAGKTQPLSGRSAAPAGAPERIYLVFGENVPDGATFPQFAEVTWCEDRQSDHDIEYVRAQPAAATPYILRRHAEGRIDHLGNGLCPDAIEGHDTRDPDCPVCIALGAASTLLNTFRTDEGDKQW